jgi:hypothetical protein
VFVDLAKQRVSTFEYCSDKNEPLLCSKGSGVGGGRVNKAAGVRSDMVAFGCSLLSRNKGSLGRLGNPSEVFFP